MMMTFDPLPRRSCSTCANWYAENATLDEPAGVIKALCCAQNERKCGGETCGAWKGKTARGAK